MRSRVPGAAISPLRDYGLGFCAALAVAALIAVFDHRGTTRTGATRSTTDDRIGPTRTHPTEAMVISEAGKSEAAPIHVLKTADPVANREPLPDSNLPLAEQLPRLVARAEAGDATATCRLVTSTQRCLHESAADRHADYVQRELEKKKLTQDDLLIDQVARVHEERASSAGFCTGVDVNALPNLRVALNAAAQNLDARQKTIIAMTRSDGMLRRLQGSPPIAESDRYVYPAVVAENTLAFLQAGYAARDPLALEGLVLLHAPGLALQMQGIGVRLPNPGKFLRYALLFEELYGARALGEATIKLREATAASLGSTVVSRILAEVAAEAAAWRSSGGRLPEARSASSAELCHTR